MANSSPSYARIPSAADSAFTLAHECGHSIHTLYSEETQPYATKDYLIFVAEIPSTLNEQVFLDYLIKNSNDKELKIQAIEQQIDGIVSTFYRQTLFADFEYQAHQLALEGKPFTYESLCEIIKNLYYTYYGIDLDTEPLKKFVWAYIPHLYNSPFYVYQYATSFAASFKLYKDVKENVCVIGGGLTGCEIAYELYLSGKKPIIIEMKDDLIKQKGICMANSQYLRDYFALHKIPVYLETTLIEIKDNEIICKDKNGKEFNVPCDNVILSIGYKSNPIFKKNNKVTFIGDCNKVGNLRTVIWEAYEAGMKI